MKFESISSSVYQLKYLKGDRLDYGQSAAASTSWNTWRETDSTTGQPPAASSSSKPEVDYIKFESISSSVYQLKYLKGDRLDYWSTTRHLADQLKYLKGDRLDYGQSAAASTSWNTWRETDSTRRSISSSVYQLKYLKGDRLDYGQSAAVSTSWNTWRETDSTTVNQQQRLPAEIPEGRQTRLRSISSSVYQLKYLKGDRLDYGQSAAVSTSWNTWRETDSTTVNQQQRLPAEIPEGRQTRLQSISSSVYQLKYLKGDRLDYGQSAAASTSWNTWRETDSTTVNQQQRLPAEIPEGRQTRLRSISSSVYQLNSGALHSLTLMLNFYEILLPLTTLFRVGSLSLANNADIMLVLSRYFTSTVFVLTRFHWIESIEYA